MNNPRLGTTRASLSATAAACPRIFSSGVSSGAALSASLLGALALGSASHAAVNTWTGATDQNWNDGTNWSAGHVPQVAIFDEDAVINSTSGFPIITSSIDYVPRDILVGEAGGQGRLDHIAGSTITGGGNYAIVGRGGGSVGVYNLADTNVPGGGLTGYGLGSGSLYSHQQIRVGAADGVGTLNINTTGVVKASSEFNMGEGGADGTVNLEAGTIISNNWFRIGWGGGGVNNFNMSGGSLIQRQNNAILGDGGPSNGTLTQTGGTVMMNNDLWIGQNGGTGTIEASGGSLSVRRGALMVARDGATGLLHTSGTAHVEAQRDFWVGQGTNGGGPSNGTLDIDGGTVTSGSWMVVGRGGGTGAVDMSGGTFIKFHDFDHTIIGSSGPGTWDHHGGLVDIQGGSTWVGEGGDASVSTLTIRDTAEWRSEVFAVGQNCPNGLLNLDGGTVRAHRFIGSRNDDDTGDAGGTGTINFNGTQIIASQSDSKFISFTVDNAIIKSGGLLVDSNGYDLSGDANLSGTGNVVKSGAGSLSLLGVNTYAGTNQVDAGSLVLSADITGFPSSTNPVVVASNASFGAKALFAGDQLVSTSISFGASGSSVSFDVGDVAGFNPTNSLIDVTGAVDLAGDVTVNVDGSAIQSGADLLLLSYGSKTGVGSFVLGSLPAGVTSATLMDSGGSLYLTGITYESFLWNGNIDNGWSTASNWTNPTPAAASYVDKSVVLFNDNAAGSGTVEVSSNVEPGSVEISNGNLNYTLTSTGGVITGPTGLFARGTNPVTITGMANTYTGVTRIEEGVLSVDSLADGGVASSIGMSTSAPSNLVLANGGTLQYTGAATTIDRGMTLDGEVTLDTANDLGLGGNIDRTLKVYGVLIKQGAGTLTFSGAQNRLGTYRNYGGNTVFDGSAGPQLTSTSALQINNGGKVTFTNDTTITTGDVNVGENTGITNELLLTGNAKLTTPRRIILGDGGSTGTMTLEGTSQVIIRDGWFSAGQGGSGTGTLNVRDDATFTKVTGDFNVADNGGTTGFFNLEDNGTVDVNTAFFGRNGALATINVSGGTFNAWGTVFVGDNENTTTNVTQSGGTMNMNGDDFYIGQRGNVIWNQTGGELNADGWVVIGRLADAGAAVPWTADAEVNVSGGVFNSIRFGRNIVVAEDGNGALNVSGTGVVNCLGGSVDIATRDNDTGTVSVTGGGLLVARGVVCDPHAGATSSLTVDDGTIKAAPFAFGEFVRGIQTATIGAGGMTLDDSGQRLLVTQGFDGTGDLTKVGPGAIALDGFNGFTGTTTVAEGTLGGTGYLTGDLVVNSGTSLAPGHSAGTFSTVNTTLSAGSTYEYEIDGAFSDLLVAEGDLVITGSTLEITELSPALGSSFVVATYLGSLTGTFSSVTFNGGALPAGWSIDYGTGANSEITITNSDPYWPWIEGFYPVSTDPQVIGKDGDPDGDGAPNSLEFALNGDADDPSNNGLTAVIAQDTTAPAGDELTLVAAVRDGATFGAGANGTQTATQDGLTYTIEGSLDLVFPAAAVSSVSVSDTAPAATGLPDLTGTDWEYHTFRLDASEGLPSKGFLRVKVD
ncbi:beta strand repeat-containing protein [Luteolibacter marinus]|uniref:beta strand repeat-containing protein n=1 Tax=Luteolibacter marinus TaxID=2776705 RepID=UPI0018666DB3|nr:autotransporter-associated beta strand repeat-containing protein [Luteolibacter marinus]